MMVIAFNDATDNYAFLAVFELHAECRMCGTCACAVTKHLALATRLKLMTEE